MVKRCLELEKSVTPRLAALALVAIFLFSIPPKWATLHITSVLIFLTLWRAQRDFWHSPALRVFALVTLPWLLPVIGSALLQNIEGLPTATSWRELIIVAFKVMGVSMGILLMLHKRYLTLQQLGAIILACLLVHALIGIGQWFSQLHIGHAAWRSMRAAGLARNPNPFGFFMALGLVLCMALLLRHGLARNVRLVLWMSVTVFLLGIACSGSRGAILTAVAGLTVLAPPVTRLRLGVYATLLVPMATAYFLSDWDVADMNSDNMRLAALKTSLEAIIQHPWIGWGIESFPHLPGQPGINAPHNMLADLALSSGLVALGAFLVTTAWLGYQLLSINTPLARTLLALLVSAFMAGTLEYSILSSIHFREPWLLILLLASYALGNYRGSAAQAARKPSNSGVTVS